MRCERSWPATNPKPRSGQPVGPAPRSTTERQPRAAPSQHPNADAHSHRCLIVPSAPIHPSQEAGARVKELERKCAALQSELDALGPGFFEELADMKLALHAALRENSVYRERLRKSRA